jgi:hypothetical protein
VGAKVLGLSTQHFLAFYVILVYPGISVNTCQSSTAVLLLFSRADDCMFVFSSHRVHVLHEAMKQVWSMVWLIPVYLCGCWQPW